MKVSMFDCRALSLSVAAAMLAGCGGSQPPIGAPGAMRTPNAEILPFPRMTVQQPLHGLPAPASAIKGIYVSQYQASGPDVFGFRLDNRRNHHALCNESIPFAIGVAVDGQGNLIAPAGYYTVAVFGGPEMCGPAIGQFHTISPGDLLVGAASTNAKDGTIAVGIVQDGGSGLGSIELCTLKGGCKTNLTGDQMNEVVGVAMSTNHNCWAASDAPTALTYFKGCANPGVQAMGYKNQSAGGLDIDNQGHLVSLGTDSREIYVYGGCDPRCKVIGGPFSLMGQSLSGHLNGNNSRFVAADYEYGQVDIYSYTPKAVEYLYSFNNGLSPSSMATGAAYDPRSKE